MKSYRRTKETLETGFRVWKGIKLCDMHKQNNEEFLSSVCQNSHNSY